MASVGVGRAAACPPQRRRHGDRDRRPAAQAGRELEQYFGSVGAAVMSLFQTVTGGVEWRDIAAPLMQDISPAMGPLFALYIAFMALAPTMRLCRLCHALGSRQVRRPGVTSVTHYRRMRSPPRSGVKLACIQTWTRAVFVARAGTSVAVEAWKSLVRRLSIALSLSLSLCV